MLGVYNQTQQLIGFRLNSNFIKSVNITDEFCFLNVHGSMNTLCSLCDTGRVSC